MATTPITPATSSNLPASSAPDTSLNLLPGESFQAYEARVSGQQKVANPLTTSPAANDPTSTLYNPALAAAAKAPLEAAANASGSALSPTPAVPVRSSASPTDSSAAPAAPQSLSDILASIGPAPTAPSAVDTYNTLSNEQGIPGIQSQIAALDKQISDAENATQNDINLEKGKPIVNTIINGRVAKITADAAQAINQAKTDRTNLVTQLTNANNTVTKLMSLQQTDYNTAHQTYTDQYNKAITLFNAQQAEMSKEQTAASANAKVIIDAYKGSNATISSSDKANFAVLESQAGLPSGFIESAIAAEKTSGTKIDTWQSDGKGNIYALGTDANGTPTLLKTFSGIGPVTKSTSDNGAPTPAQQSVITDFKKSLVDPTDAQAINDGTITREEFIRRLQAQYGGSGVNDISPDDIMKKVYETYPDKPPTKKGLFGL